METVDELLGKWPQLVGLLDGVRERFGLAAGAEVTTEANPESVDPRTLAVLREGGFTRVSVGMQHAAPHVLATLDRVHTPGRAAEGQLRALTEPGVAAVAILLTGVPGRTTDELVVLTRPGASRLGYAAESNDDFRVVEPAPGLDGIYLIDRAPRNEAVDHLVLDNPSSGQQLYSGPVSSLLCGEKSCS